MTELELACVTPFQWRIGGSAPTHSALCIVLAGFAFQAIVTLSREPRTSGRTAAHRLLPITFVNLLVAAFFFSLIGGEEICARAAAYAVPAAITMAMGTIGLLVVVSWLVAEADAWKPAVGQAEVLALGVMVLGARHVGLTVEDAMAFHPFYSPSADPFPPFAPAAVVGWGGALIPLGALGLRLGLRRSNPRWLDHWPAVVALSGLAVALLAAWVTSAMGSAEAAASWLIAARAEGTSTAFQPYMLEWGLLLSLGYVWVMTAMVYCLPSVCNRGASPAITSAE